MESPAKYYQRETTSFIKSGFTKQTKNRYLILNHTLSYVDDVESFINRLSKKMDNDSRVVVISFNFFWKPVLNIATYLGLRKKGPREPNWLDQNDIKNIFYLMGLEEIKRGSRFLLPLNLGLLSKIVNRFVAQVPIINYFCLTNYQIFRLVPKPVKDYSVSIIIPAKNEKENVRGLLKKIPRLSKNIEVIFVEGHSKDNTLTAIKDEIKSYKGPIKTKLLKQNGIGKADAVNLGLSKAKNEMLIIFDADLSVYPNDLKKFYQAIKDGKAELANGSRLVYPLEGQAMQTLNIVGNKIFSLIFSYLLGQTIKDTLCGTKVLLKKNYNLILKNKGQFGNFDPFGDYNLLFGASKLNLKITDIPVRYHERKYGKTNISRFQHGLLLLKMTLIAARKLKFI